MIQTLYENNRRFSTELKNQWHQHNLTMVNAQNDVFELLADASEGLQGKLRPAEFVVDQQSLVEAARSQNKILKLMQEKIFLLENDVDFMRNNLTKRIDGFESTIQRWGDRIENLDTYTKVPLIHCSFLNYFFVTPQSFS